MSKASFMSMKWLRLHIKSIIYATVTLFVLSIFAMGYGTTRAARHQEDRQRRADEFERLQDEQRHALPSHIREIQNSPVVNISYPAKAASFTKTIDARNLYRAMTRLPEFEQLEQMPESIRGFYHEMIRERSLEQLISLSLIELFAQANQLQPPVTPQMIVEQDRLEISPADFDRRLRRDGITEKDYGMQRLQQLTIQAVAQHVIAPVSVASATEEFLLEYYNKNKKQFRNEDLITFKHLLVSAEDFEKIVEISEEEIKDYFDRNRDQFRSSERVSASHIVIEPLSPAYLSTIEVSENQVQQNYTDNRSSFRVEEKVHASHILIRPKNSFDASFEHFKINVRDFYREHEEETGQKLISFNAGISHMTEDTEINISDIYITCKAGQVYHTTFESLGKVIDSLDFPVTTSARSAISGRIAILTEKDAQIDKLIIDNNGVTKKFNISSAFDEEESFNAAMIIASELRSRALDGEDFSELAKKYSDDTASALHGGDLGIFKRGAMVKPFEEAAFSADEGEITEPVRTRFGYHVIQVIEKLPSRIKKLDEVRDKIVDEIRRDQAEIMALTQLEDLRRRLLFDDVEFEDLARRHSSGRSRTNGGRLPVFFKGEITSDYSKEQQKILINEIGARNRIAPEVEQAVYSMVPGQVSQVVESQGRVHLFKLHEFISPIQLELSGAIKKEIESHLRHKKSIELASINARQLIEDLSNPTVAELVKHYEGFSEDMQIKFENMPFSRSPGLSSPMLARGTALFTSDGMTYLPGIHEAMVSLIDSGNYHNKVAGPIGSDYGYHFIQIIDYETDRYEKFDDVRDDIFKIVTLQPTEEEIQELFEEHKDQFARPASRRLRQIVLHNETRANEIWQRLEDGEIFSLLASNYSVDSTSSQGGMMGSVTPGQLSYDLDKAVWALEDVGQYTKPVKTNYGYVIAMLDAPETPAVEAAPTPEIRSAISRQLRSNYQELAWSYFLNGLMNDSHIIRFPDTINSL